MLSLLKWSLGTNAGDEPLTDKENFVASEKRNSSAGLAAAPGSKRNPSAAANRKMASSAAGGAKRKRVNSAATAAAAANPAQQRAAKRSKAAQSKDHGADASNAEVHHSPAALNGAVTSKGAKGKSAAKKGSKGAASRANARTVTRQPASTASQPVHVGEEALEEVVDDEMEDETGEDAAAQDDLTADTEMEDEETEAPEVSRMTQLQQRIESEFSMEILLKHNELRLIEQEIAKCQVALEQLRRCKAIPYPSMMANPKDIANVATGKGRAVRAHHGDLQARNPAPWGVKEGPYSRHYAMWLLPDTEFDGGYEDDLPGARASKHFSERHTRGGKSTDLQSLSSRSRAQRGLSSGRLQALPAGYPEPKEEKGPMILKRAQDGKMVKLVCLDCHRENFNSAQGFINHCRIAHSRGFASHEAAAIACGQEVDVGEPVAPAAQQPAAVAPGVLAAPHSSTAAEPQSAIVSTGLVHQYNRNGAVPILQTPKPKKKKTMAIRPADTVPAAVPEPLAGVPFQPSMLAPNLSKLFAKSGRGGNLEEIVGEAKTEFVPEEASSDDGEMDEDDMHQESLNVGARMPTQGGLRGGLIGAAGVRQPGLKGSDRPLPPAAARVPRQAEQASQRAAEKFALAANVFNQDNPNHSAHHSSPSTIESKRTGTTTTTLDFSHSPIPHDLSPNTAGSNNAPSLVSDREEDDDEDDDYEAASQSSEPSSGDNEQGSNGEEVDDDLEVAVAGEGHGNHPANLRQPHHPHSQEDPELGASSKAKTKIQTRARGGGGRFKKGMSPAAGAAAAAGVRTKAGGARRVGKK